MGTSIQEMTVLIGTHIQLMGSYTPFMLCPDVHTHWWPTSDGLSEICFATEACPA